ncbi:MAG: PA14 domain-containing protein [Sedimentisphaerales bacterium]
MKNLWFVFIVAFAFCSTAMASDIAISTQAGWFGQGAADAEMQEIVDNVTAVSVELFTSNDQDALAGWVADHTGDGTVDLLILCGQFPDTIYEPGNSQADDSLAELFLDDGNAIINTGDYMFYVVNGAGTNAAGGLQTMMDIGGTTMWDDDTAVVVTAEGQEFTPTLQNFASDRPFHLNELEGDWEAELIMAQNDAGTRADPVIVINTATGGRLGIFYQTAGQDGDPRGEVISEWINNWFLLNVAHGNPFARKPDPKDGVMHADTWISVSWAPGDFAASHDVYFGDNFDDVNDGTGDAFRGNQGLGTEFYIAGFPGYAYENGLVPGTTYYWRIDEVNDANAASPWKGKVWSFWIPPKKAYDPVPANGAQFIPTDEPLSWTAGFGAKLHYLHFGDDYDTVANATGGSPLAVTNFSPGPLEPEKMYYWRVDEFEAPITNTGDVWSFTTAKIGGGIRGDYYNGMNFENFMLTRTDPEINFNWGDPGGPDPAVGDDSFSCRWTGEVEAAYTETYTFYAAADDGVRLWVDGVQLVNAWVDQGTTEYSGTIDLIAGNSYSIIMEQYENGGGATAYLRWSSPSTPKQIIPEAALAPPVKASSPSPANGAEGTRMEPILRWGEGESAVSHEVYFGTDADAVANADKSSLEYKGTKALGDENFDPGKLAWHTSYYWRIDEVNNLNPDSPWIGNLWSFTTGDFLVIDDIEDYDAGDNQIWYSWIDGLGFGSPGTDPYNPGNGTGAAVGDETTASYTEETIVHGGSQSMPLAYDNNKQGYAKYSETELTLTAPRDWTEEGVTELSLWFMGYPASTGSFVEAPVGTYTMTASGADIWLVNGVEADEFHFAYKMLTGAGSMVARVDSVENTNVWAKAGVMIRETLDPDSAHAMMVVTPGSGVSFQRRPGTGQTSLDTTTASITAPYWVKLERSISGTFTASHSVNGSTWTMQGTETISMGANVYIGLALTSHDAALTCQAVFSNVTTTGTVGQQWAHQDIGIASNAAEPLYVAVSNSTGTPAVMVHDDPAAAQIDTWTEWVIQLQDLADKGLVLTNVDRIVIGLGTQGNMTIAGGSGKMFFDDIRLYRPREVAE